MTLEQIKKLIITANLSNLTKDEFFEKVLSMIQAEIGNSTIVPNILPTPAAVKAKYDEAKDLILQNDLLLQQQKSNTGKLKLLMKDIKNDIISKWSNQVQNTPGITKELAALLGFGSKGFDDGHSEPKFGIANSFPEITKVDASLHLQHTLTMRNNMTGKIGKPYDVKGTDVFMFIGTEEPKDFRKSATYLGKAERGKYTVTFTEDQVGLTVWYYAVYVGKKAGNGNVLASKIKKTIS